MLPDIIEFLLKRGDLAHMALFLWASSSTLFFLITFSELTQANRRFDAFIKELAEFNKNVGEYEDV